MGKSTSSCLKLIACGAAGDSADDEGLSAVESKAPSDKRRWSFRKRSARHRVLSNSVISEPLSVSFNKEKSEASTDNIRSPINSLIPEKAHKQESLNETPSLSSGIVNLGVVDTLPPTKIATTIGDDIPESVAVVIQSAIRASLAQRELHKLQNVVKLQAAVRGHLVRRQAVGTLRCIHAIVRMQALVRARYAHKAVEKSADQESRKNQRNDQRSAPLEKNDACIKPSKIYSSMERLFSNVFARQLLESSPKTKSIQIKCDPSKPDSAWNWLERWMAVTSSELEQLQDHSVYQGSHGQEEDSKPAVCTAAQVEDAAVPASTDPKLIQIELEKPTEVETDAIVRTSGSIELHVPLQKDDGDWSLRDNDMPCNAQGNFEQIIGGCSDSSSDQLPLQSDATSIPDATTKLVLDSSCDKPETDRSPGHIATRVPFEPLETEGKRFAVGSRKACNPAFVAAQSKFEELSSNLTVARPIRSTSRDASIESKVASMHAQAESLSKTENHSLQENSDSQDPRVQVAASECGTEISITSTLDSSDRSETEGGEIVLEIGSLEKANHDVNGTASNKLTHENINSEANNGSLEPGAHQLQNCEHADKNLACLVATVPSMQVEQQPMERIPSDSQGQMENPIEPQHYRSSPEASPRSHTTVPESQGTPSSQISVNAKKSKKDNSVPTRKQTSQVVGKKSPSNLNSDSGGRNSTEHLSKDAKNSKRRNSFGITKPDHLDHEPRISSSNSVPSYMQATESARAKAHVSISPESSPDVHDKNNYLKKRHSLPIANGKQGSSPRMHRSTSQAQQNLKRNGTHSPHNSAERRWQR